MTRLHLAVAMIGALIILSGLLGYRWIDTAISLDYARQEQALQRQRTEVLESVLQLTARRSNRREISRVLKERFGHAHVIREDASRILVDDVALRFENDLLVEVAFEGREIR